MENNTTTDQNSQYLSNIDVTNDIAHSSLQDDDYKDMPPLIDDIEYSEQKIIEEIDKFQKIMLSNTPIPSQNNNELQDSDNKDESDESDNNDEDSDEENKLDYVLCLDDIPLCSSNSFKNLQQHSDNLIKDMVAKYMDTNNVYVSNNGVGDYSVSVRYKNSIWPVEKCVGRFVIQKIKRV